MWCWIYWSAASVCSILGYIALPLGWLNLIVVILKLAMGPSGFNNLKSKTFARLMDTFLHLSMKKSFAATKKELFSSIGDIKSTDTELRRNNALNILEVGVGSGANLEFYPAGSRLTCVDPNAEFESFFRRECSRHAAHLDPDIRFAAERGEDMASVADASADVVVSTFVLCSVTHLDSFVREVRRVLVPGGKFFFMEHIGDGAGTWRRRVQNFLSNSGLWPVLLDGCVLNSETKSAILAGNFAVVDQRSVCIEDGQPELSVLSIAYIISPILFGVATK